MNERKKKEFVLPVLIENAFAFENIFECDEKEDDDTDSKS